MSLIKCVISKGFDSAEENTSKEKEPSLFSLINIKTLLLIDANIDIPKDIVDKTSVKLEKLLKEHPEEDIILDFVKKNIELHINRQTEDMCNILGFTFVINSGNAQDFKIFVYGSNSVTIDGSKRNNQIIETSITKNDIVSIDCVHQRATVHFEELNIFERANEFIYSVYTRNRLNSFATTTLISIGSISYMTNQAANIKEAGDIQTAQIYLLENINSSLNDQNDTMARMIVGESKEEGMDSIPENSFAIAKESEEMFSTERENLQLLNKEKNILEEEKETLKSYTENLKTKYKRLNAQFSAVEKVLRLNGFDYSLSSDEGLYKFKEWVSFKNIVNATDSKTQDQSKKIQELENDLQRMQELLSIAEENNKRLHLQSSDNTDTPDIEQSEELQKMAKRCDAQQMAIIKLQQMVTKLSEYIIKQEYAKADDIAEAEEVNSWADQVVNAT